MEYGDEGVCEDDTCGRALNPGFRCRGTMIKVDGEGCRCHINPPCSSCVDAIYYCSQCGFETEPPYYDPAPLTPAQEAYYRDLWEKQVKSGADWIEYMHSREPVTEFRARSYSHSNASQRIEGRYPPNMTQAEVLKRVEGTFGGRFTRFGYGFFEYIAATD